MEYTYFTPAEFMVMLELSGEGCYTLLRCKDGPELDREALTQAFLSLFQRDLLRREKNGFSAEGPERMFTHIHSAPFAVFISGKGRSSREAICYVGDGGIWLVELVDVILAKQYRIRRLDGLLLREWLFDTELLEEPVLQEEDAKELSALFADELEESRGNVLLVLEKYVNGGPLLSTWEVLKGHSGWLIRSSAEEQCGAEVYTDAALSKMLRDCFGEE